MNTLLKSGILVLVISAVAFIWANSYLNAHPMGGVSAIFGNADTTYDFARNVTPIALLGFLVGLVLLGAGLFRKEPTSPTATTVLPIGSPFVLFWSASRLFGALFAGAAALTLVFALVRMNSLESQFRRSIFDSGDETLSWLFVAVGLLLATGIPLLGGVARNLTARGWVILGVLVVLGGPFGLWVAWPLFLVPALKAKQA